MLKNLFNKHLFYIVAAVVAMCAPGQAAGQTARDTTYVLLPDSSNFVKASLIVVSPGDDVYTSMGHCALRMECPSYKLDFCFSYGTNNNTENLYSKLKFFTGQTNSGFLPIPTHLFLKQYEMEGREVKQTELNLTPDEKKRLWQLLDEDMIEGEHRKFNYISNNCSSVSANAIKWSLINEQMELGKLPDHLYMVNCDALRYVMRDIPWMRFVSVMQFGAPADDICDVDHCMCPENIHDILAGASFVPNDDSAPRPVFKGKQETLLPQKARITQVPVSPMTAMAILLAVTVVITALEWKFRLKMLGRITDTVLLSAQTVVGLMLLYLSTVAGLFGPHWNWYLIVFNPIPAIVWLIWRNKVNKRWLYSFYTVVLLIFVSLTPFSSQLDIEHQLITLALAVRCASNCLACSRPDDKK